MTFDDHFDEISRANAILTTAIRRAAEAGIKVQLERLQFSDYDGAKITLSRQATTGSPDRPLPSGGSSHVR